MGCGVATSGRRSPAPVLDTSAAVALLVADHDQHDAVMDAVGSQRVGLAGHAAFETFSVLTRLPPPMRREPAEVAALLAEAFPTTVFLPEDPSAQLLRSLPGLGIAGGAVYDALVGAAARHHRRSLLSLDRRAAVTYARVGTEVLVVD